MDMLKALFPLSFRKKEKVADLVVTLIFYGLASGVCECTFGLLGQIPLVGFMFRLIGWVVELYLLGGVILTILHYTCLVKD